MKIRYNEDKTIEVVEASRLEFNQTKIWLNRFVKGYKYMPSFKRGIWDGKSVCFKANKTNVGLWKEMARGLQEIGCKLEIENKKDFPINRDVSLEDVREFCEDFFKDHKIKGEKFFPYDHQIETAYKILRNKYCTGEVATGGGKSLILSIVFFYILKNINPDAKILLIVPSILLVNQMTNDILEYYYGIGEEYYDYYIEIELEDGSLTKYEPNDEIKTSKGKIVLAKDLKTDNVIKGGIINIREIKKESEIRIQEIMSDKPRKWLGKGEPNIYISTYQSLAKITNFGRPFYQQFHTVACDEAHLAKSESFKKIMSRTLPNSKYQFGVSGTFQDDGFAEYINIQNLTGPKVTKVDAKELQDKGIISNVRISQIHLNHDDPEFYSNIKDLKSGTNSGAEIYRLEGEYIRESEKRLLFIDKIINKLKSNTLVLFNIIEYGDKILDFLEKRNPNLEFHLINGSINKKKREEIKEFMEKDDGKIRVLVASYGTLSVGVSIKNIHNIIFCESFKAEQRIIQAIGRSLRLFHSKEVASVFDLVDMYTENSFNILKKHGTERLEMYRKHKYPYKVTKYVL